MGKTVGPEPPSLGNRGRANCLLIKIEYHCYNPKLIKRLKIQAIWVISKPTLRA